jgi:hypothetical protein
MSLTNNIKFIGIFAGLIIALLIVWTVIKILFRVTLFSAFYISQFIFSAFILVVIIIIGYILYKIYVK